MAWTEFPVTIPPAGQAHEPAGDPATGGTAAVGTPLTGRPVIVWMTWNESPEPLVSSSRLRTRGVPGRTVPSSPTGPS